MPLRVRVALLVAAAALSACAPTSTTAVTDEGEVLGAVQRADDDLHAWVIEDTRRLPDITLTDTDGAPFNLRDDTAGTPTLLFFGYTSCPDVCPVHLATIAAALERPGAPELGRDLQMVFVSVDPGRDTPDRIRGFLDGFDPGYIGLTGDEETVAHAMNALDLPPAAAEPAADDGAGTVGHVSQVTGFDRDGVAQLAWPWGTRQSDWAADLPHFVAAGADR